MGKDLENLNKLIEDYKKKKDKLTDEEKAKYLSVMVPVSKKYNIDLKERLKVIKPKERNYNNPLDNKLLLKALLYQRYNNCLFNVSEIIIPGSKEPKNKSKYSSNRLQEELINKITNILEDKITNYATEDINDLYKELLISNDIRTDKKIKKLLKSVTDYHTLIGNKDNNIFKVPEYKQNYKILINTPNDKETFYFLNEYIEKCITNNIDYEMIGYQSNNIDIDHTILYASKETIDIKLNILDEIAINKPMIISSFGTPPQYASTIGDSYYSVTNIDVDNYNDYINNICEVAYYRVLSKLVINKIEVDKDIIDNFISLNNVTIIDNNPLLSTYNNIEFNKIKDLINVNIPDIMNTLKIYMEQEDKMNILVDEFKKSIEYITNIINNNNKKDNINIAIDKKGE